MAEGRTRGAVVAISRLSRFGHHKIIRLNGPGELGNWASTAAEISSSDFYSGRSPVRYRLYLCKKKKIHVGE